MEALRDETPEVRFWACFALGSMGARPALPELQRLAETDEIVCPGWWRVKDEAVDAVYSILHGVWPDLVRERTPG
jgi:HEAT repeat protein